MTTPLAMRPAEAAKLVGMGRASFYRLLQSGEIPSRKVGAMRLILVRDLEEWLNNLPTTQEKEKQ